MIERGLIKRFCLFCAALALVAACGKSDDDSASDEQAVKKTTISGSVYAAPVSGASVMVMDTNGTTVAGPVNTDSGGSYSVEIPDSALSGDLMIEASGGTFTDEATNTPTTAGNLSAYVTGGSLSAGSSVHIDPATSIVHDLVKKHGKALTDAKSLFSNAFGFVPDFTVAPKLPTLDMDDSTVPQRLSGLRAWVFSQIIKDLGLNPDRQFDLIAAVADDLSDGMLDGKMGMGMTATPITLGTGTIPADIPVRFVKALQDASKTAWTPSYKVEYLYTPPMGMMNATEGKTTFKIKISDRKNNLAPVMGKSITIMPVMHMPTKMHSTAMDAAITDNNDGTYTCTVYYVMAGVMKGMLMGFWELKVMIPGAMGMGETATFYPYIGMAMGDTMKASLKGQADLVYSSMTNTTSPRSYLLFRDGPISAATPTFNLFIATQEDMMHYPAVFTGKVLSGPTGTWMVSSMSVQASTDAATWIDAVESGNSDGRWSVGLSGLVSNVTSTVYVKLSVNGEEKTTNGLATSPTGTNGYASFKVKPQ